MSASAWHQFLFIGGLGLVVSGLTTYLMIWVLVGVTLRDRHPAVRARLGVVPFTPRGFGWFLGAAWRRLGDTTVTALAAPGTIGAWAIVIGAVLATVAKTLSLTGAST